MMLRNFDCRPNGLSFDPREGWSIETAEGRRSSSHPLFFVGLLPLLESPFQDVAEGLKLELNENVFPFNDFLLFVFETGEISAYWKALALDWLLETGLNSGLTEALRRIRAEKRWPQSLRHSAGRVLKKFKAAAGKPAFT